MPDRSGAGEARDTDDIPSPRTPHTARDAPDARNTHSTPEANAPPDPGDVDEAQDVMVPRDPRDTSDRPIRPLDSIDLAILRLLRVDGRASIRSVAEQVHISRANAYSRMSRLLDEGVIRGFSARIDHERAGQGAAAYIGLRIVQDSWRSVREKLERLPGAAHIALVGGEIDVLLLVHTCDYRALRELVFDHIQPMPEVLSTRTLLVFEEADLQSGPLTAPDR